MNPYATSLNRRLKENGLLISTTVAPDGWLLRDDGRDPFIKRVVNGAMSEMEYINRGNMRALPKGQMLLDVEGFSQVDFNR